MCSGQSNEMSVSTNVSPACEACFAIALTASESCSVPTVGQRARQRTRIQYASRSRHSDSPAHTASVTEPPTANPCVCCDAKARMPDLGAYGKNASSAGMAAGAPRIVQAGIQSMRVLMVYASRSPGSMRGTAISGSLPTLRRLPRRPFHGAPRRQGCALWLRLARCGRPPPGVRPFPPLRPDHHRQRRPRPEGSALRG